MPTPRKPIQLHAIEGTLRKDRHVRKGHDGTPIDPQPRPGMDADLVGAWHELIEAGGDFLAQSDRIAVELAAVLTVKTREGNASAAETAQLVALLGKLGCTPTGRRGLDRVRQPEPEVNPFSQFRSKQ